MTFDVHIDEPVHITERAMAPRELRAALRVIRAAANRAQDRHRRTRHDLLALTLFDIADLADAVYGSHGHPLELDAANVGTWVVTEHDDVQGTAEVDGVHRDYSGLAAITIGPITA